MKPRRSARWRRRARLLWSIQRFRLARIAAGLAPPLYSHEHLYMAALRAHGRANPAEFVLPGLLFLAEDMATSADPPR